MPWTIGWSVGSNSDRASGVRGTTRAPSKTARTETRDASSRSMTLARSKGTIRRRRSSRLTSTVSRSRQRVSATVASRNASAVIRARRSASYMSHRSVTSRATLSTDDMAPPGSGSGTSRQSKYRVPSGAGKANSRFSDPPGGEDSSQGGVPHLDQLGRHTEFLVRLAQVVLRRAAGDALDRRADVEVAQVRVEARDDVGQVLDKRLELLLGLAELGGALADLPYEGVPVRLEAVDGPAVEHRPGSHLGKDLGESGVGRAKAPRLIDEADQPSDVAGDDDRCDEHVLQGNVIVTGGCLWCALCQVPGDDDPAELGGACAGAAKRHGQANSGAEPEAAGIEAGNLDALAARRAHGHETGIHAEDRLARHEDRSRGVGEGAILEHRARCRQQRGDLRAGAVRMALQDRWSPTFRSSHCNAVDARVEVTHHPRRLNEHACSGDDNTMKMAPTGTNAAGAEARARQGSQTPC